VDSTGKPLPNLWFTIRATSDSFNFYSQLGLTDSLGHLAGTALHVRTVYTLNVYQYNFCGAPVFSKIFTTPNTVQTDLDLGSFVVEPVSAIIIGTAVDCNNNPVKNGSVTAEVDIQNTDPNNSNLIIQQRYHSSINADGSFQLKVPVCKTDSVGAAIYVEDATGNQVGNKVFYSIHYPATNIGKIQGCNSTDTLQFLNITIDSNKYSFHPNHFIETPGDLTSTFIIADQLPTDADFRLFGFLAVGKPNLNLLQFELFENGDQYEYFGFGFLVNINEYGPVGGYIAGNIQDTLYDIQQRIYRAATVNFRVKRKR
jgi:hypothetical protein